MHHILVVGAGKIGTLIAFLFAQSKDYFVYLADIHETNPLITPLKDTKNYEYVILNAKDESAVSEFIKKKNIKAVVSSLPFHCNLDIAKVAAKHHIHYFDLTEDVETTNAVKIVSQAVNVAFVPQCGLAPGFISIVANHLMSHFHTLDTVKMRVGALPTNVSNGLQYALTWSTEGLINEYGNLCHAIDSGKEIMLQPLEGLEEIKLDGWTYEAFNTSGGIGNLAHSYNKNIKHINYKSIRYPGHCEKIKFLMNDLRLNEDRKTLKAILENVIPKTYQDVVLVYVSVTGMQDGQLIEENYFRKFYPKIISHHLWSAIQLTTASQICAVVDLVLQTPSKYVGLINQEVFALDDILTNRFGQYFA